jgi:hypothetical protein
MAFTGKARDWTGLVLDTANDLSEEISIISPREYPFLDLVGDGEVAALEPVHRWAEQSSLGTQYNYMQLSEREKRE